MIKLSEGGIAEMWKDEKSPEMQAISYALQKAVAMVIEKAEKTKCFSDIDKLDEKTLDYFAVEQRAMYYSQTLPIEQKKAIIKNTLNWYTQEPRQQYQRWSMSFSEVERSWSGSTSTSLHTHREHSTS